MQSVVQFYVDIADQSTPCFLLGDIETLKPQRQRCLVAFFLCFSHTSSKASQASLLGAKKVKDPGPSISGLSFEMSEYFCVEVAFTRPNVLYTWSTGATMEEIYKSHYWTLVWICNILGLEKLDLSIINWDIFFQLI